MTNGFLIGKFMPPHAGHIHLCDTARRLVDRLTILVCALPDDPIPGPLRLAWMREMYPTCRVIGYDGAAPHQPGGDPAFGPLWRDVVRSAHPEPIDRIFAGEPHWASLAAEVGAEFVPVGPRLHPGLSGSAVRADPWGHWRQLPAAVRPQFARTICLHGPESTGKSVLSERLARHFGTVWTPEYGRVHCELFGFELDAAGLITIAEVQQAMIAASLRWCDRRLIADTDALTTAAWSIMILGHVPEGLVLAPLADLYLLTDIDVPWEDDGTRYFPDAARRRRFMQACRDVLDRAGADWVEISGSWEERFEKAVAAIEALGPPFRPSKP